jgi:hypothetical protein
LPLKIQKILVSTLLGLQLSALNHSMYFYIDSMEGFNMKPDTSSGVVSVGANLNASTLRRGPAHF